MSIRFTIDSNYEYDDSFCAFAHDADGNIIFTFYMTKEQYESFRTEADSWLNITDEA